MSDKEVKSRKKILDLIKALEKLETEMSISLTENVKLKSSFSTVTDAVGDLFDLHYVSTENINEHSQKIAELSDADASIENKLDEFCQEYEKKLDNVEFEPLKRLRRKVVRGEYLDSYDKGIIEDYKNRYETNEIVWFNIGRILKSNDDKDEAYFAFQKATDLVDDFVCAWCEKILSYTGDDLDIINTINNKLLSFEAMDKEICSARISTAYSNIDQLDKSIEIVDKMMKDYPDSPVAYNTKGLILKNHGDLSGAAEAIIKAIEKEDLNMYHINLANVYKQDKKYEDAIKIYNKLLSKDKMHYIANISLARIYLRNVFDPQLSLTHVNRALESPKSDTHDICIKANAYYYLGRKEQALELYEKAISVCDVEKCKVIYGNYLNVLFRDIDDKYMYDLVSAEFDEIKKEAMYGLIILKALIDNNKIDVAKEVYEYIDCDSLHENESVYNQYAWQSYKLNKTKKGLDVIKKALKIKENDPRIVDTYACLLYQDGKDADAIRSFKKAVEKSKSKDDISIDVMKEVFIKNNEEEEYELLISKFD